MYKTFAVNVIDEFVVIAVHLLIMSESVIDNSYYYDNVIRSSWFQCKPIVEHTIISVSFLYKEYVQCEEDTSQCAFPSVSMQ